MAEIHECDTCGILHRAKEVGRAQGPEAEVEFRVPHCVTCVQNPNRAAAMSIVDSMGLSDTVKGVINKLLPPDADHWIPIESERTNPRGFMKRCADCDDYRAKSCKVSPELNAKTPPDECPIVWEMENE